MEAHYLAMNSRIDRCDGVDPATLLIAHIAIQALHPASTRIEARIAEGFPLFLRLRLSLKMSPKPNVDSLQPGQSFFTP